jgi:hypothetical protein
VQAADTVVLGTAINVRCSSSTAAPRAIANSTSPAIRCLGLSPRRSPLGRTFDTQNSFELQNNTSMLRHAHALRFGIRVRAQFDDSVSPQNFNGTFTFGGGGITSIERYRRTLLYQQLGYSPDQIRVGGRPVLIEQGIAGACLATLLAAAIVATARRKWSLPASLVKYLMLGCIGAMTCVAIAWAPGATAKNPKAKTVMRAGFGMFYDRFGLSNTLAAQRFNGIVQQQYVVTNPDFFPAIPPLATLGGQSSR